MRRFKALLSALSSCRRRGGTQTHSSSMPGSFKPCGFHGKTVDWHLDAFTHRDSLECRKAPNTFHTQTTSPSQDTNEGHMK